MVGILGVVAGHNRSRRTSTTSSTRSSVDEGRADGPEDETTVVEPEQGNVLSHIISQLRPGADLSRVVLPTFILEPRSMLERITNFMAHPETLLPIPEIDDPVLRFAAVVKFYLSGWHIKPPGVKKPLNPILGETFTCYWTFPDNTKGYYISEQTSHHPPKSSYFYMAPEHNIRIDGCLKPRSKFLGNSAASLMEGIAILRFLNRGDNPKGESYTLTQPNMYARGILFGKMKYELGDHSFVRCPELGLAADLEFKTKGWVGGTYNAIAGTIKNELTGQILYELGGMWTGEMTIKDMKTGKKEVFFDAAHSKHTPPTARPLEEQDERESQKLWHATAQAVIARNHELATDEKTKIEDQQREEARRREEEGVEWQPKLFRHVEGGPGGREEGEEDLDWILSAEITGKTPEEQVKQILAVAPILDGQKPTEKNPIPQQHKQETVPVTATTAIQAEPVQSQGNQVLVEPVAASGHLNDTSAIPIAEPEPTRPQPKSQTTSLNGAAPNPEIENLLAATGSPPPQGTGPLMDFHKDIERDLNATPRPGELKREDTDSSVDEFVDAEG